MADGLATVLVFLAVTVSVAAGETPRKEDGPMNMTLESSVFRNGDMIPPKYTCDGEDVSPPLSWANPPGNTASFSLVADDPDAPMGTWVHWVVFNIPAAARGFAERASSGKTLPAGSVEGMNDFRRTAWGGPCPPSGVHRYFFRLYTLDATLQLRAGATKTQLLDAMKGHILAQAELMGKYARRR